MKSLQSLALVALLCLAACAVEREPVNYVQPNALLKENFQGEWYYQRTVVDVPAASGFTFVGNSGTMEKVSFDIQESYLYVRRNTEHIKGADDKATAGEKYSGEVTAAFKILSHFDIKRAYNATTGEELNVLEENTKDRPWYQREFMRVDWSNNLVHNYDLDFEAETIEGVPFYAQETNPDGTPNPDAPKFEWIDQEQGTFSYFDITSRIFAKAGTTYFEGYGEIPLCWLMGQEFTECGAGEYGIRHSFLKRNQNHQYVPEVYKGAETDMFGFFWADRLVYDAKDGIKQQYKERYIARHNIWKNWTDASGKPIAEKDRTPRPIVYHVNREFPEDLKPTARKVAGQWNKVFQDVVAATGNPYKGDMFILCDHNPVQAGDPVQCGKTGSSPRLGDVRYSFMAYVPKYMTYGLLGLGPSNKDPETGEIISGMAYIYHHNNVAAYRTQEMVELLNGTRDPQQFIQGEDLTEWAERVRQGTSRFQPRGLDEAKDMVERITTSQAARYWDGRRVPLTPADEMAQESQGFGVWAEKHFGAIHDAGHLNGEGNSPEGRLARVNGTPTEKLLMHPELKLAAGFAPDAAVTDEMLAKASLTRGQFRHFLQGREQLREQYAAQHDCMYLPELADDALMGVAKELKDKKGDEVYAIIRDSIYTAVLAHEVGHSLGLMHNFGGSDDAVNYFDEYWKLRDDGKIGPRLVDPMTDEERDGKIYNYAYSSIMDYAGRYTIDGAGVGKYDRAAMLYGYANKVEVFVDDGKASAIWKAWYDGRSEVLRFLITGPEAWHYTEVYKLLGAKTYDASNRKLVDFSSLYNQKTGVLDPMTAVVDGKKYTRVPYVYCSHGRSDLGDSCLTRDFGGDSQERMANYLDEWDTWYITRSFPRGAVGMSNWSYASRTYGRLYQKIKQWHDIYGLYNALLPRFYSPAQMQKFLTDPVKGWGGNTWAVQNAFNYLIQTILMPDVGGYTQDVRPDGTKLYAMVGQGTQLGVADARYYSTNWTFGGKQDCGWFWGECLEHIGFYVDKVMAIMALTDSTTHFVARANPIDIRDWEVGYYNTFSDNIRQLNAALQSGDWSRVGPYFDKGKIAWPNYAAKLDKAHANAIDPAADFTIQLYFALLGQARLVTTFDRDFLDEAAIWVAGTGKAPQLTDKQVATYTDPGNGLVYAALDVPNGAGKAMIDHANVLKSRSEACDLADATTVTADDCSTQTPDSAALPALKKYVQLLKAVAEMQVAVEYGNALNP